MEVAFALACAVAFAVAPVSSVSAGGSAPANTLYPWRLPAGFPSPRVAPADPVTPARVELGRHLFHDPRLSGNGTQSCASCHRPELAFTDGRAHAVGSTGELHPRSAMSLANVAYNASLTWADRSVRELEQQALVPLHNRDPVEMGVSGHEREVLARLRSDPRYRELFAAAFPDQPPAADLRQVARAIAAFERTLISGRSPYDRMVYDGDMEALSEAAWRGMTLFFSARLGCAKCHSGFTFSGPSVYAGSAWTEPTLHDTGLYTRAHYADPATDGGLAEVTGRRADLGRFRAPTVRNISVTGPYMHDGSIATLDQVIDHYAGGGRAGVSRPLVGGFALSEAGKRDLIEFLRSLTDEPFLSDVRFTDPWTHSEIELSARAAAE